MTQNDDVRAWLESGRTLTQREALDKLGILRLASRVNDLKRQGAPIKRRMIAAQRRGGKTAHVAQYYMEETNEH